MYSAMRLNGLLDADLRGPMPVEWLINKKRPAFLQTLDFNWWRGEDLNL
jgi:hypothetical protein